MDIRTEIADDNPQEQRDDDAMMDEIGFYTLSDARCRNVVSSARPRLSRCELLLTSRCNFRCPYCRSAGGPDVEYNQALRTVTMWARDGLRAVRFSGGEPTIWPGLVDLVRASKSLGIERVAISTNGSAPWMTYESLLDAGADDFSVSLDACCSGDHDEMTGVTGTWQTVCETIRNLSKRAYTTVGIVVTSANMASAGSTIELAANMGAHDIRVIPAAQSSDRILVGCDLPKRITDTRPILRWRWSRFMAGATVRGLSASDSRRCHLVRDDMAVADGMHYPCIIYLREGGKPIGKVGPNMRTEREEWSRAHDCHADRICKTNCLDFCREHNNTCEEIANR